MSTFALEARDISKSFSSRKSMFAKNETFVALENLSFSATPGETIAFLGPNGAGKSTTIKMICGILSPTTGASFVMGHPSGSRQAAQTLGLVFGTRSQLWMHMTVAQSLEMIGQIYHLSRAETRKRIAFLGDLFEIGHLLEKRTRSLSLGQRMRCELVSSLIHKPRVLLADEPTIGLDVVAKNQFRELLKTWQREEQTTLLLTSHDLSDVELLCQRCILIDKGFKKFDGPLASLKGPLGSVRRVLVTLAVGDQTPVQSPQNALLSLLKNDQYVHQYEFDLSKLALHDVMFRLLKKFFTSNMSAHAANPANLVLGAGAMIVNNAMVFAGFYALYFSGKPENNNLVPYFVCANVIAMLGWGTVQFFLGGLGELGRMIENAELDPWLATPRHPLLLIAGSQINVPAFGDVLFGLASLVAVGVYWGPFFAARTALAALICICAFVGSFILAGSLAFFVTRGAAFGETLTAVTLSLSTNPSGQVFLGAERWIIWLSPALVTAFLPLEAIINASWGSFFLAGAAALVFITASVCFFNSGLKRYVSGNFMRMRD